MIKLDVLAVMDKFVADRKSWLPEKGFDMCGSITPDLSNPIHQAALARYQEAVEAREVMAELIETLNATHCYCEDGEGGETDITCDRCRVLARAGGAV